MKKNVRWTVPLLILIVTLVLFALAARAMSRSDNSPVIGMPMADPTRPGASLQAQAPVVQEEEPKTLPREEDSPAVTVQPSGGQRVPSPLFWMVLGGTGTAVGILVATHEKKRKLFS